MYWVEGGQAQTREQVFDRGPVTIGRGVGNQCTLTDSTRVISTKHAELRERSGVWRVCDVGSVNGTVLNGVNLVPKEEYELHDGDQLEIGAYRLEFHVLAPHVIANHRREEKAQGQAPPSASSEDRDRLEYLLHRAYGEFDGSSGTSLEQYVESGLLRALEGIDRTRAQAIVQSLRLSLQGTTSRRDERSREPQPSRPEPVVAVSRRQAEVATPLSGNDARRVYDALRMSGAQLDSDHMAMQVAAVLSTLFAGLADSVRGRRKFQKEFEIEATRILAWKPNPIKHADSASEIAAILLDPASCELTEEEAIASLDDVLQDLTLHQLGLMAGFRECLRGLLKELAPESVGKASAGDSKGSKLGLLSGGGVRADAAAWRRYVDKHRQLTEEEVKVFERILAPHFAKGYLSVHKARKPM